MPINSDRANVDEKQWWPALDVPQQLLLGLCECILHLFLDKQDNKYGMSQKRSDFLFFWSFAAVFLLPNLTDTLEW